MSTIRQAAKKMADAHRQADPDITQVYLVDDPNGSEVRLVEVSGSVGNTGSILPFRFAARPDRNMPYASVVILVSPEEKQLLDDKELDLPESWGESPQLEPI
jgi:hypothetical protein